MRSYKVTFDALFVNGFARICGRNKLNHDTVSASNQSGLEMNQLLGEIK
jgi:hypothetical protein